MPRMPRSQQNSRMINIRLIVLTSALAVVLLEICHNSARAIEYKKALSFGGKVMLHRSGDRVDYSDPTQYHAEDSLITRNAKSNTISKALRYVHKLNGDRLYKRMDSIAEGSVEEPQAEAMGHLPVAADHPGAIMMGSDFDERTDDEVIMELCELHPGRKCNMLVRMALNKTPEVRFKIALALRNKPDHVDGLKLLSHKLFESAIRTVEERNIDDKLDKAVDLLMSVNPATRTGMIATKMAKHALKPALDRQLSRRLSQ